MGQEASAMKIVDLFSQQLDREAVLNRRALERVPEGRRDWKPHEKSMPIGYLATLVATMPEWIAMMIKQDALDLKPASGPGYKPPSTATNRELLQALDASLAKAREALRGTTDEHLMTPWKLLVTGHVVAENPRHVMIADTFMHMAHHRGQLTVYLRLSGAPVPALYGPSADEASFA
jgi:uncharacterized damage-inducible protein DinB